MGRKLRNAWAARLLEGNQAAPAAAAGKGRAGPVRLAGASVTSAARTPAANASTAPIRILGLDTALRCTGFGVIDTDGQRFAAVDCGLIRIPASAALSECLRRLSGGVVELLDRFAPDVIAIEGGFFFKNVKTATVLGMARGAVVARLAERRLPVYEYAPRRVKQAPRLSLVESDRQFIFKGGTSLLLHMPQVRRLSRDIDNVCGRPAAELDAVVRVIGSATRSWVKGG